MAFRPAIRIAESRDGECIRELLGVTGSILDELPIDWSDLGGNWLVAERSGQVVGCLQVCPAKAIGRLEHLGLDTQMSDPHRAACTKFLIETGYTTLRLWGSQCAMAFVPFDLAQYKRILKRRGCIVVSSGNFMLKRLV